MFINWKDKCYNLILIIIDWLTKIVYYKLVKIRIDILYLANDIFNIVIRSHSILNSIIYDQNLVLISKCWLSLSYFFSIKY